MTSLFEQHAAAHPGLRDDDVVRAICERLLDEGEITPPVDVDLIASLCGIVAVEQRDSGPTGMLAKTDRGWVASVLADDGAERQRFTVLHEGGHTLLPGFQRGGPFHRCKGERTREEELCDVAASELLLPRRFFVDDLATVPFDLSGLEDLAGAYKASVQATAVRSVDLSTAPAAMVVLSCRHKPSESGLEHIREPKLRVDWARSAGPWPYVLRDKSVAPDSALRRAWEAHEPVSGALNVDELLTRPLGPKQGSARRYGDHLVVLLNGGGEVTR
jgi:hypothetical protein